MSRLFLRRRAMRQVRKKKTRSVQPSVESLGPQVVILNKVLYCVWTSVKCVQHIIQSPETQRALVVSFSSLLGLDSPLDEIET